MRIEEAQLVPKPCPWARLGRARCPNGARGRAPEMDIMQLRILTDFYMV